jgi:hypothetical protein
MIRPANAKDQIFRCLHLMTGAQFSVGAKGWAMDDEI